MSRLAPVLNMVYQRAVGHWRLLSAMVTGVVLCSALMACVFLYSDAIRDLGLKHALQDEDPIALDLRVVSSSPSIREADLAIRRTDTDSLISQLASDVIDDLIHYGRSATFYLTAPGNPEPTAPDRPRAHFQYVDDLADHVRLIAGKGPAPRDPQASGAPTIEVFVGKGSVEKHNISLGQEFDLYPHWRQDLRPVRAVVVGVIEPKDPGERYWSGRDDRFLLDTPSWPTYPFFISEDTFVHTLGIYLPDADVSLETYGLVDTGNINSSNARTIEDRFRGLESGLRQRVADTYVESTLAGTIASYREKLFFTRLPLFALMLQIVGIALFYLVMVATMIVDREIGEIALLKSRGASTRQIMTVFAIEGLGVGLVAMVLGPFIAAIAIAFLGYTPPFADLSGGDLLDIRITTQSFALAGFGAVLAFVALLWPAYRACRYSITNYKQQISRPPVQSAFLKYYLDLVLIGAGLFAFYQLRQQGGLATEDLFGGHSADPLLLLAPSLFMLMMALVFLRIFPIVLRLAVWLSSSIPGPTISLGLTRMVRSPVQHSRLILLLILTTAVGMFAAGFRATLEQGYEDRASYQAIAKTTLRDVRQPFNVGNEQFVNTVSRATGAQDVSPAYRTDGYYSVTLFQSRNVTLAAYESKRFEELAFWRSDFAGPSLGTLMARLRPESPPAIAEGLVLPPGSRFLGLWAHVPVPQTQLNLGFRLVDRSGIYTEYRLLPQGNPLADGWQFFAADLTRPTIGGAPRPLVDGKRLDSLYVRSVGTQPQVPQPVSVLLDEVQTTTEAALPADVATAGFRSGAIVESFDSLERYELISGASTLGTPGAFSRTESTSARAGSGVRIAFTRSRESPTVFGLRTARGSEPLRVLAYDDFLDEIGKKTGDEFQVYLNRQYVTVKVVGSFSLFPGFDPGGRSKLFVADLAAAQVALSRLPVLADGAYVNEALIGDDAPNDLSRDALQKLGLQAEQVLDRDVLLAAQSADPLVAASWEGILFLSFGAVLLLSTLGFVTYSVLSAESRSLEFALLRTMGFSGKQVLGVVSFEQCFVILAGVLAGTLLGFPLGRLMIGYMGITESGGEPLPPLISRVSWQAVATVYFMLATVVVTTVTALVLLYSRLAVGRALRMGEL